MRSVIVPVTTFTTFPSGLIKNVVGIGAPIPTTFLINPDGKVVKVVTGTMTERMVHDYMNLIKPEASS